MKIGLIDVDSKIPNLALMKLSTVHKMRGDTVNFYMPFDTEPYDIVYASKIFTFTNDYQHKVNAKVFIKGGSGYSTTENQLVPEAYPDYTIYKCDYAIGYTTRGCVRKCPWCVVPDMEGKFRIVENDIRAFWNGQEKMMLLDNIINANTKHLRNICKQIADNNIKVDFQGIDIRLINDEQAKILSGVRLWKNLKFAWDDMSTEDQVIRGIEILKKYIKPRHLLFYVLIGFDTTRDEDMYRVETLRGLGVSPFVMPFNKNDQYQKEFSRWVNHKAIFKSVKWENYRTGVKKHG